MGTTHFSGVCNPEQLLPPELWLKIIQYIRDVQHIKNIRRVARIFRELSRHITIITSDNSNRSVNIKFINLFPRLSYCQPQIIAYDYALIPPEIFSHLIYGSFLVKDKLAAQQLLQLRLCPVSCNYACFIMYKGLFSPSCYVRIVRDQDPWYADKTYQLLIFEGAYTKCQLQVGQLMQHDCVCSVFLVGLGLTNKQFFTNLGLIANTVPTLQFYAYELSEDGASAHGFMVFLMLSMYPEDHHIKYFSTKYSYPKVGRILCPQDNLQTMVKCCLGNEELGNGIYREVVDRVHINTNLLHFHIPIPESWLDWINKAFPCLQSILVITTEPTLLVNSFYKSVEIRGYDLATDRVFLPKILYR